MFRSLAGCLLLLLAYPALASESESALAGAEPPAEALIAELPFAADAPRTRIVLDLAPEGQRPLRWLLDTGAEGSVMTPGAAREARVSIRREKSSPYRRATRLGRDVEFWVDTRSSDTGTAHGFDYALLGGDFLDDYVLEIDYPARKVRFLDPERYAVPEAATAPDERVIPLRIDGHRPFAALEYGGRSTQVLLDTGAFDNAVLSGVSAKRLGIDWRKLPDFGRYGSTVKEIEVRVFDAEGVRFAGFELDPLPLVVAPQGWFNIGGNTDSTIGYDILRQFVLRIDYERERLWLRRSGDPKTTYAGVDYALMRASGAFVMAASCGFQIFALLPDTPAARRGLQPGDALFCEAGLLGPVEPDLAAFAKDLIEGREVTVARPQGRNFVDVVLPAKTADEGS